MDAPQGDSPSFRKVLVDTSLLIEQQKGSTRSQRVRSALAVYGFKGASTYSKLEIKRAWAQRLGYIYNLCRLPNITSVADVLEAVNRLSHPGHQRLVRTCIDAILGFLREGDVRMLDRAGLARLRAHCKNAVLSLSESIQEMVTGEFDGTACVRAAELPRENADGSLDVTIRRCRPDNIQCTVHTFFEENRGVFDSIARYVDEASNCSDELKHMRDHIRTAQANPVHLCDDKHCCKLADMLIAVDGRDMDEFAANNDVEWIPISQILGKPLVNPMRDL